MGDYADRENGVKNLLDENASESPGKLVKFCKKIKSKKCDFSSPVARN